MRNNGISLSFYNDVFPASIGGSLFFVLLLLTMMTSTTFALGDINNNNDNKSFQSGPTSNPSSNFVAGGFLYDPNKEVYYLTGSTHNGDDTDNNNNDSSSPSSSNCFLKLLSKDLQEVIDEKFYDIEKLSGVASSVESCNIIEKMLDESSIILGGSADIPPRSSSLQVQGFLATIQKMDDDDATAEADDSSSMIGDVVSRHSILSNAFNYPVAVATRAVGDDNNNSNEVYAVSMTASSDDATATATATASTNTGDMMDTSNNNVFTSSNGFRYKNAGIRYDMTVERYTLTTSVGGVGRYNLDWTHLYSANNNNNDDGGGSASSTAGVTVGGMLVKETSLYIVGTTKGYGTAFGGTAEEEETDDTGSEEDGFITQLDLSTGNVLSSKRIIEPNVANPNEHYVLTNICDDPNDDSAFFVVGAMTANTMTAPIIMRFTTTTTAETSSLERQWSKVLSTTGGDAYALSCQATSDDSVLYVAGQTRGGDTSVTLEGSSYNGGGNDDVFVVQLDVSGGSTPGAHLNWCQQIGSTAKDELSHGSNGLTIDEDGNAVIYGHTYGNLFREKTPSEEQTEQRGTTDLFVVTFSKEDGSHSMPLDDGTIISTAAADMMPNNDESVTHRVGPTFNTNNGDVVDDDDDAASKFDYFSATLSPLDDSGVTGDVKFFAPKPGSPMEGMVCFVGSASGLEPGLQSVHKKGGSDCTATNGCGVHVHTGSGPFACANSMTQGGHWWDSRHVNEDPWMAVGYYETDADGSATYSGCVSTGSTEGLGLGSRAFIVHSNDGSRVACGVISLDSEPTPDVLTASTVELDESGVASEVTVLANLFADLPDHVCFLGEATGLESNLLSVHVRENGGADCMATNGCGVHIHAGIGCGDAVSQGGHYYNPENLPVDPWLLVGYTNSNEEGHAMFADCVQTGETDYKDRPFIIHSNDGRRVSCGLLSDQSNDTGPVVDPSEPSASQEALDMIPAPITTAAEFDFFTAALSPLGDSGVTGEVKLFTPSSGPMEGLVCFIGLASGLEPGLESTHMPFVNGVDCTATNGCGVHLHTGVGPDACTDSTTQGGHLWDDESFPEDPWKTVGYYQTDADGNASYSACVSTGLMLEDLKSRAFIVHANNGSRVACGVLEPDSEPPSKVLFASTVELGESGVASDVNVVTNFFANDENSEYNDYVCFLGEATGVEPNLRSVHDDDESGIAGMDCTATNGCGVHIHSGTGCDDTTSQGGHFYDKQNLLVDPWLIEGYSSTNEAGDAIFANCVRTGETDYEGKPFIVHSNDGGRVSCGILLGDSIQEEVSMVASPPPPAPSPSTPVMKDSRNLTIPIYVGAAVAVLVCCCCFVVCVQAKRRTEAREKQRRMLAIFKYLHVFDVNDIDIRRSPAGGYHGTYLNDLAMGEGVMSATDSNKDSSSRESTYRPHKVHASLANDYTFMSHRALQALDPDDDERSIDSQTELSSAL